MAWARIDDQFPDHPKVVQAGPLGLAMAVAGICYASQYLTDGFIPRAKVRRLIDVDNALEIADTLVKVGLWEEIADGYQIHDYLEYNPSAEDVRETREAQRAAKVAGGQARAATAKRDGGRFIKKEPAENQQAAGSAAGGSQPAENQPRTRTPSPEAKDKESNRANTPVRALARAGGVDAAESLVHILCEESGFDISEMTRKERKEQRGHAAGILGEGFSEGDVRGCLRYLLSQPWRDSKPDLLTVHRKIGQWKREGCPAVAASRASPAGNGRHGLTAAELAERAMRHAERNA